MVKEESAASVGTRPWTPEGKKSDFVHCLYALAGYNGMAFPPWVTLPGENPDILISFLIKWNQSMEDNIYSYHPAPSYIVIIKENMFIIASNFEECNIKYKFL
ncbi:hypothetical protein AVEN_197732-1 [Araneus ventricosus]|uniref:Uncharacterized protein n=1 Tax=Araneus ventricosus TaxID=182803 RepID=A0A4Y2CNA5_ARAVE|nr:hypothetical protein AVEN_197732-1 [Araneus ventricosus]